jgi:ubiquinone/menaquinone biosynthesis C-methylase UbiE
MHQQGQFKKSTTSWDEVSKWYDQLVGERGSDFHQQVVMPGALKILKPVAGQKILDLACGQGVFCRELSKLKIQTVGVDAAKSLIDSAINRSKNDRNIQYKVLEAQNLRGLADQSFDASSCLLAIQNIDPLEPVISEVTRVTKPGGKLAWVLTHPCFRIPRQSGWGIDEKRKLQYRRVDHYLSPLKIPIYTHPGSSPDLYTWTFHRPLSF